MKIVLASASPRRKKLLQQVNLSFEVDPSTIHEEIDPSLPPDQLVKNLAEQKGRDVAPKHPASFIIAADTLVWFNKTILSKPENTGEAKEMLCRLSGNTHSVYSGVFLCTTDINGDIQTEALFSERTKVTFSALSDQEIARYVQTGNPLDKAGAYGIQDDWGALFVKKINGDYNNVVGFPLHSFYQQVKSSFPEIFNLYFNASS